MRSSPCLPLLLLSVPLCSGAQSSDPPSGLEPIPDGAPQSPQETRVPVPEITLRQGDDQGSVEEYRVGGILYMIKVNPAQGASYYLVDTDGDGNLETRVSDLQSPLAIPAWVLLRW